MNNNSIIIGYIITNHPEHPEPFDFDIMAQLCLAEYDLILKLRGADFPVKDSWMQGGKADPYLIFLKNRNSGDSLVVPKSGEYMGEVDDQLYLCVHDGKKQFQRNTLDPVWPPVTINARDLCDGGNVYKPFIINFWDYDFECPNDDFMGYCVLSIFDLIKANLRKEGIPLQPGKAGHKWGGFLFVDEIKLCNRLEINYQKPCKTNNSLFPIMSCIRPSMPEDETPSTTNNSFLHLIAENGDMEAVLLLLEWNADINALNMVMPRICLRRMKFAA